MAGIRIYSRKAKPHPSLYSIRLLLRAGVPSEEAWNIRRVFLWDAEKKKFARASREYLVRKAEGPEGLGGRPSESLGLFRAFISDLHGAPRVLNGYGNADAIHWPAHRLIGEALHKLPPSDPRYLPLEKSGKGELRLTPGTASLKRATLVRIYKNPPGDGGALVSPDNVWLVPEEGYLGHLVTDDRRVIFRYGTTPGELLLQLHTALRDRLVSNLTSGTDRPKEDTSWLV